MINRSDQLKVYDHNIFVTYFKVIIILLSYIIVNSINIIINDLIYYLLD